MIKAIFSNSKLDFTSNFQIPRLIQVDLIGRECGLVGKQPAMEEYQVSIKVRRPWDTSGETDAVIFRHYIAHLDLEYDQCD